MFLILKEKTRAANNFKMGHVGTVDEVYGERNLLIFQKSRRRTEDRARHIACALET